MAGVDRPRAARPSVQPGVVPGDDRVEAERERPVQQRRELDLLVAAQARVRGAAGRVLGDEVVDHVGAEPLGEVPDVERDAEHVGGPPGVVRRPRRVQQPRDAGAQRRRRLRQRQVHAGDVVPGVDGARGGHRGVDAAAHRGEHPHRPLIEPHGRVAGGAGPPGPLDHRADRRRATASTSAAVEVWPSENRSEPRAARLVRAHREQHVEGWATPAVQAEPVEHSMPCASSSISSESPSQPGNDRCALPGSRTGRRSPVPGHR